MVAGGGKEGGVDLVKVQTELATGVDDRVAESWRAA